MSAQWREFTHVFFRNFNDGTWRKPQKALNTQLMRFLITFQNQMKFLPHIGEEIHAVFLKVQRDSDTLIDLDDVLTLGGRGRERVLHRTGVRLLPGEGELQLWPDRGSSQG